MNILFQSICSQAEKPDIMLAVIVGSMHVADQVCQNRLVIRILFKTIRLLESFN